MERGRTLSRISSVAKYGGAQAGANFRGRKSNSLMNLCGGKQTFLNKYHNSTIKEKGERERERESYVCVSVCNYVSKL